MQWNEVSRAVLNIVAVLVYIELIGLTRRWVGGPLNRVWALRTDNRIF